MTDHRNKVVLLSIGDELLIGQTVNTNFAWLSAQLDADGFEVIFGISVRDRNEDITQALDYASTAGDIIISTGGLGPTADDITKPAICSYFGTELILHEESLEQIRSFFKDRGMDLSSRNRDQALVPASAGVIQNRVGTAPGLSLSKYECRYFFLPGVPFEMQYIYEYGVRPILMKEFSPLKSVHRNLLVHGIGESYLSDRLMDFEQSIPQAIKLAYLPSPGMVRLRLTARGDIGEPLQSMVDYEVGRLKTLLGSLIFGEEDESIEEVIGRELIAKGMTLAVAESCTGGNVSRLITRLPGASAYFKGSIVAYANEVKADVLHVDPIDIVAYGAVSEEVAMQMCENVRSLLGSDYGLATTGIAGPGGGSTDKPVGTVFLAMAGPGGTSVRKHNFGNHRGNNILRASMALLDMLRLDLQSS